MLHTETVSLEHRFSDKEMAQLAREQAEDINAIATMEDRLSSVKKDFGARIDEKKASVRTKSQMIQSGHQWRDIRCLFLKEQPVGHQIGIRLDTAVIVKCRRLRHDERQMELAEGVEAERQVASAVLAVNCPDMEQEAFEVFLTQRQLELLVDAPGFAYTVLPDQEPEPEQESNILTSTVTVGDESVTFNGSLNTPEHREAVAALVEKSLKKGKK